MATFSLQAQPADAADWLDLARRAEAAGFHALYAADHPGSGASPFVALAAAAAVTSRIELGPYVVNAGIREPLLIASDVATLDVVSGGRAILGIGAGHTPAEWTAVGRVRPDVAGRVRHCIAVAEATVRMLAGDGLDRPRPVRERVPVLFGGGNTELLRWAATNADVIGLSGLGRTLADGHTHTARFHPDQVDAQVELAGGTPVEALVHYFAIGDDAGRRYATWAADAGISPAAAAESPYLLAGTAAEIRAKLQRCERRWGLTRYVVRRPAFESMAPLLR
ncbi:F420-dependent oxidoreductase [Actinoplanes sp. SE50]|uniref:LLM class flavin-dependent oxidoreductase n=1 Tax=unclassified Actinoplanes TaxID=2626549 RepID=UPI00023EC8E7|nr:MULTISPECIES: LLM class flavin-dependent oxidoreductase [unclassified Actinoplanes]AEV82018.1 oxidoreductase [Actinoplanes sp. SE50/110]ATO80417.1 F420-dependent oxidoreductase [Actinoplanes sp. SE50]SLL97824.1 F420-dependent oxidoreductase [Actinoplanes sp. SE50/110]